MYNTEGYSFHRDIIINGDFIGVLEFNKCCNRFEYKHIPIDRNLKYKGIYEELCRMRDDKSFLLEDLVRYFRKEIPNYRPLNYCLPYDYSNSYIEGAHVSENIEDNIKESKKGESANQNEKNRFLKIVGRWFNAYDYYQALNKINNNNDIKVWSSEKIGWTTIEYIVNEDLKVYVSTNFAYGGSSYFHLSLRYKDLLITPYTEIITYYKANVREFRTFTRSYAVERDSWDYAFKYLEEASNLMLHNPNEFVQKYIVEEIDRAMYMLSMCTNELKNGNFGILGRVTIKKSTPILSAWDMTDSDKKDYEVYKKEMDFVFVVEKLDNIIEVFGDLGRFKFVYNNIDVVGERLKREIDKIYQDVENKSHELSSELEGKENQRLETKTEIAERENEFNPIQEKYEEYVHQEEEKIPKDNSLSWSEKRKIIDTAIEQFKTENPKYEELKKEISKKKEELIQIENDIIKRENFKNSLDSFLKKYQDVFVESSKDVI